MKNLFLCSIVFVLMFSNCEKEERINLVDVESNIQTPTKANNDCVFNDFTNIARVFNYCGTDFVFQGSVYLDNVNNIHRIQAYGRCYKLGNDPSEIVDYAIIEIEVGGEMHIGCGLLFDVTVPNDYNANLVGGEVPNKAECEDCGETSVNINYKKDVTLLGDDFVKANFRIKMDGCGGGVEEMFTVVF